MKDSNLERSAVKMVFVTYQDNLKLLSEGMQKPDEAQLAMDINNSGQIRLVDDIVAEYEIARRYNEKVDQCVKRLPPVEQKIIKSSYMTRHRLLDWQIYESLHVERSNYYVLKARAIARLYIWFVKKKIVWTFW